MNSFGKLQDIWALLNRRGQVRFWLTFGMGPLALVVAAAAWSKGYWYLGVLLAALDFVCMRKLIDAGWRFLVVEGNRNRWTEEKP